MRHLIFVMAVFFGVMVLATPAAQANDQAVNAAKAVAAKMVTPDNLDRVVHYTVGVNPSDYPCARAGIVKLFENRQQISSLSSFHPRRIFTWLFDMSAYYVSKVVGFFKDLMNPGALTQAIKDIQSMARGGNPFSGAERKIDGWFSGLGDRSKSVLKDQVHGIIRNTTNGDGSCKASK